MDISLTQYFLLFIIYSFCGWLLEVICKLIQYKRFINRGFLIGPYCPIYGWGAVAITFFLYKYSYDKIVLFIMTIITCAILEYATSLVMEKLFKARWWDYSKRKFNIDGRICLGTTIPFGLFGMFITYVSNPFIINSLNKVETNLLNSIAIVLLIIYVLDTIISTIVIFGFRKTALQVSKEGRQDNTEQITKKVRDILAKKSWMHKRLINAYPRLVAIKYKIKEIKEEVKENAKELKDNINDKAREVKTTIKDKKEEVRNNLTELKDGMKETLTDTGKIVLDGFEKRKTHLYLSKKNVKNKYRGKKL